MVGLAAETNHRNRFGSKGDSASRPLRRFCRNCGAGYSHCLLTTVNAPYSSISSRQKLTKQRAAPFARPATHELRDSNQWMLLDYKANKNQSKCSNCAKLSASHSFYLHGRPGVLQAILYILGLLFGYFLFHRIRSIIDQRLGLFEPQAGDLANHLYDLDLLLSGAS